MTIPEGYTAEQWDSLTDEEQEGILSDDGDEEEEEEGEAEEQARLEREKEAEQARQAEEEARAAAAAKKQKPEQPAKPAAEEEQLADADQQQEEQQEEEQPITRRPRGVVNDTLPEDYDARVKANDDAQDKLEKQYEDGDISFSEYRKEQRKLDREGRDLERLKDRADLAQESSQNAMHAQWDAHIGAFLPQHPELTGSTLKQKAFDECLRATTGPVLEAGGMPGVREIQKAYEMWCGEFNFTPQAKPAAPAPKKQNKVPPTLGALPASTQTDTEDGRWANLDRLADADPEAYEEALSRMSAADRDAYMQA